MKQIRIATDTGEKTFILANGAVPALISGELTVVLHDGETLRVPNSSIFEYVVGDAKRPTKLDALVKAHEEACEAVEVAASDVYVAARQAGSAIDVPFTEALLNYVRACEARDEALNAIKAGQVAAARAKAYAEKRKADKAAGVAPAKKKTAKKAAKKAKE